VLGAHFGKKQEKQRIATVNIRSLATSITNAKHMDSRSISAPTLYGVPPLHLGGRNANWRKRATPKTYDGGPVEKIAEANRTGAKSRNRVAFLPTGAEKESH
jgi:hypothetical protein